MPGRRKASAEIGGQGEGERRRGALLRAAVRILDEVARAFAEADERGGRGLDVQPAEAGHDAGGQLERLARLGLRLSVGGHDLRARRGPRPGSASSKASRLARAASPSSAARARPTARARTSKRTSLAPPPAIGDRLLRARPRPRARTGSRLRMVTIAVPLSFSWLCSTAPKRAVSPSGQEAREGRRAAARAC